MSSVRCRIHRPHNSTLKNTVAVLHPFAHIFNKTMIPALDLFRILQFRLRKYQGKMDCLVYEMLLIKKYRPSLNTNQTQYVLKYSLDFVFSFASSHWMIHWLRTLDYCFRFSFYLLTYVNFLHFLDNGDRVSSKRQNLSALVFLINSTTKVNLVRQFGSRKNHSTSHALFHLLINSRLQLTNMKPL